MYRWSVLIVEIVSVSVCHAAAGQLRISQVWMAGGLDDGPNGAFVELFNAGGAQASLDEMSVQVSQANSATWESVPLPDITMPARSYYLVRFSETPLGRVFFPDLVADPVNFLPNSVSGRVALVSKADALVGVCPIDPSIVDLVGYGTPGCSEGSPALPGKQSPARGQVRGCAGLFDTDDNLSDFSQRTPMPRNGSHPPTIDLHVRASAQPASVDRSQSALVQAQVFACAGGPPAGVTVTIDARELGLGSAEALVDDGTLGDVFAGDGVYSRLLPVSGAARSTTHRLTVSASDTLARSGAAALPVTVTPEGVPGNGACAGAVIIDTLPVADDVINGAGGDDVDTSCNSDFATITRFGVWYELQLPAGTVVRVRDISIIDSVIAVFEGPDCFSAVEVACGREEVEHTIAAGVRTWVLAGAWSASQTAPTIPLRMIYEPVDSEPDQTVGACCVGPACTLADASACAAQGGTFTGGGGCVVGDEPGTACCEADSNRDGSIAVGDILDFLSFWSLQESRGDSNGDGVFAVGDILDLLSAWSGGCS